MKITPLIIGFVLAAPLFCPAAIDQASAERTAPRTYKIAFQASPDAGAVDIYASAFPDRIDSGKPLVANASSPVSVTATDSQRVYFHLKPKSGPVRVVATREIPLEGSINFRDLGGYATTDGQHVRWGMIFRWAKLDKLTDSDFKYLTGLGLKLICDFRIDSEAAVARTQWKGEGGPELWSNPIDTVSGPRNKPAPPPATGSAPRGLAGTYRWMAIEVLPEFAALMRRIANGQTPTLFHCQEGRGRTGLFAALLLQALGVPRPTIMQDFMLTNDYLLTDAALTKMMNAGGGNQTIDSMRQRLRISEDDLNASFAAIDESYPNFEDFLLKGLKLTPAEIGALHSRLLEP